MNYNSDFKYDLKIGQVKEVELGELLNSKTIEVKHDLIATKTQNVFIEYECRDSPSGISTTKADYYCFCINNTFHLIETVALKEKCRKHINTNRDIRGGDNNTSKGILLPIIELF